MAFEGKRFEVAADELPPLAGEATGTPFLEFGSVFEDTEDL